MDRVNFRRLGDSDLEVSEISLGSWLTYGAGVERETASPREAYARFTRPAPDIPFTDEFVPW